MKNDFVTSKDFKGTLIEKSFQSDEIFATTKKKDVIEKAEDYSKWTSSQHKDEFLKQSNLADQKQKRSETQYRSEDVKRLEDEANEHRDNATMHAELSNEKYKKEKVNKLEKSESTDLIEKSAHKKHKYLTIKDGKYIYDHSKMTSKDHHDAAEHHSESLERHERLLKEKKSAKDPYSYDSEESYNEAIKQDKNLHKEHENIAWKKEAEERKAKAKDADKKLGNALSNYDKSKDEELYNDKGYNKKGEYNEDFDEEELAKKNTIKKSEAFDILIGNDFEDRIEKSKGPWKKGKHPTESID